MTFNHVGRVQFPILVLVQMQSRTYATKHIDIALKISDKVSLRSTIKLLLYRDLVIQWSEYSTVYREVVGSNPIQVALV